jgi:hypothetical protein
MQVTEGMGYWKLRVVYDWPEGALGEMIPTAALKHETKPHPGSAAERMAEWAETRCLTNTATDSAPRSRCRLPGMGAARRDCTGLGKCRERVVAVGYVQGKIYKLAR